MRPDMTPLGPSTQALSRPYFRCLRGPRRCAFILHIPNYWHARATPEDVAKKYEPFKLRLPYEYYRLGNATSAAMERFWASRGPQPGAALALGGAGARGGALGGRGSKGGGAGMGGVKRLGGKQRGGGGKAIY